MSTIKYYVPSLGLTEEYAIEVEVPSALLPTDQLAKYAARDFNFHIKTRIQVEWPLEFVLIRDTSPYSYHVTVDLVQTTEFLVKEEQ